MMNDDHPSPATPTDVLAASDLPPGEAGIPRLLDAAIWHIRNAHAATKIVTAEDNHPADNWATVAGKWDHVAVLVAELRDRIGKQAAQ